MTVAPAHGELHWIGWKPSVLIFDVNETLIDIESMKPLFKRVFGDECVLREWFGQLILYSMTLTLSGLYKDFFSLGQGLFEMLGATHKVKVKPGDIEALKEGLLTMPAHADVKTGLAQLKEFATRYMWWFFLIQAAPLPEHMIGADPEFFLEQHFAMQNGTPGALTEEALREYQRCFCTPEAIHASCEDYCAAAEIDLEMDEADEKAGRKVEAPILALWGSKGAIGKLWSVPDVWRQHAHGTVEGCALDCGHYLAEERPQEVLREFLRFFND